MIEQRGWSVTGVEHSPPFAYTTGLTGVGHPEFLVSGLPHRDAVHTLNARAAQVLVGRAFAPGEVFDEPCGHRWALVAVSDPRRLIIAVELYALRGVPISALQVVWSDRDGHFPGSPGWRGRRAEQELFGRLLPPAGTRQACRSGARRQPVRRRDRGRRPAR